MVQAIVVGECDLTLDDLITASRDHARVAIAADAVPGIVVGAVTRVAGVLGFVTYGVVPVIATRARSLLTKPTSPGQTR